MAEFLGLWTGEDLCFTTVPGAPWSKSRPRFGKGRTFTKKEDIDAEERTRSYLERAVRTPFTGNVGIGCLFFRPNRQRIDTDNLLKHVCDAAQGVLWVDDYQCTAVMGVLELDVDNPRTVIVVGSHITTMTRGTDAFIPCVVCETPIYLENCGGKIPKTCSVECRAKLTGGPGSLRQLVPCLHCGEEFKRINQYQKLCSPACRLAYLHGKRKGVAGPFSCCMDCGKQLTHRRGGRCRDCWKLSVVAGDVPR
jgi:Holliday junction resolvase RusA-like endonuclease